MRYLAAREHSRAELEAKLRSHETEEGELARVLDELTAKGFISEARVVETVLRRRAGNLGNSRVLQELRQKGISPEALAEAEENLRATELDRAREAWRKKFRTPATTPAERARQMRFLATRGFSGDIVRRVMRGDFDEIEDVD